MSIRSRKFSSSVGTQEFRAKAGGPVVRRRPSSVKYYRDNVGPSVASRGHFAHVLKSLRAGG